MEETASRGFGLVFCLKEVRYFRRKCSVWRKLLRGEGWEEVRDELSFEPHLGGPSSLFTIMPNDAIRPALGNKRNLFLQLMKARLACVPYTVFDWCEFRRVVQRTSRAKERVEGMAQRTTFCGVLLLACMIAQLVQPNSLKGYPQRMGRSNRECPAGLYRRAYA